MDNLIYFYPDTNILIDRRYVSLISTRQGVLKWKIEE